MSFTKNSSDQNDKCGSNEDNFSECSVDKYIDFKPLIVTPETLLKDAANLLARKQSLNKSASEPTNSAACILVVTNQKILGILTSDDLWQVIVSTKTLASTTIASVMSQPVMTIRRSQCHDFNTLWSVIQQNSLKKLPVLDDNQKPIGVIDCYYLIKELFLAKNRQTQQENLSGKSSVKKISSKDIFVGQSTLEKQAEDDCQQTEIQLQQERNFSEAVINTVGALVAVLDRQGKFVKFNNTCQKVTGYSFAEVEGKKIWDFLILPAEREAVQAVFDDLLVGQINCQCENHWLAKDGSKHLISWSNTTLFDAQKKIEFVIATGIDVTEQRRVWNKLEFQYQQSKLLTAITDKIRMSIELDEILQTTVNEVKDLLTCDRVVIVEIKPNNTAIPISEAILPDLSPMLGYELADPLLIGKDLFRYYQGEVLAINDLATAPIDENIKELLAQFQIKAKLVVPILSQNQLKGLLVAHQCYRTRKWKQPEIHMLIQLADRLGVALSQAQLLSYAEKLILERTKELTATNELLKSEIADRKGTERDLRENQDKLAGILDNADEAIISINEQQQIQLFNQGAERIFGYQAEDIIGRSLDILLPKIFRQVHRQHISRFGSSAQQSRKMAERNSNVFGRRKDGYEFPAEASVSKLQTKSGMLFTVILKDISDRIQAEKSLRRSEKQLKLITDALPVLIAYIDEQQRYRYNNRTYEIWFNKPSDSLQGKLISEVIGNQNYQKIEPYLKKALVGETVNFESQFVAENGSSYWVSATYIPDFDVNGEVKGFFSMIDDITHRKTIERLKSEFISIASHEMRTPLTSIHGIVKLLSAGHLGELSTQGQAMADMALRNSDRLVNLVNDILDLERMESGRDEITKTNCDSNMLIQSAIDTVSSMAKERQIEIETNSTSLVVNGDCDRLTQTLTNLLSNAIKFSENSSKVIISSQQKGDQVLFKVEDKGRGIPNDKLATIFERFQQVDASDSRKKGGTGLGLAICRHIVHQHGGKIWVESVYGKGSTFYLQIPLS